MTKTNQNFSMVEGDNITLRDIVENADGSKRNLTDHDGRLVVSEWNGGPIVFETPSSDSKWTWVDKTNGEFQIELAESDTQDIVDDASDSFHYEIELTDTTGDVDYTVTTGKIQVTPSN